VDINKFCIFVLENKQSMIERYIKEIIEAGEFFKNNPDFIHTINGVWAYNLEHMNPASAIGQLVQDVTED